MIALVAAAVVVGGLAYLIAEGNRQIEAAQESIAALDDSHLDDLNGCGCDECADLVDRIRRTLIADADLTDIRRIAAASGWAVR